MGTAPVDATRRSHLRIEAGRARHQALMARRYAHALAELGLLGSPVPPPDAGLDATEARREEQTLLRLLQDLLDEMPANDAVVLLEPREMAAKTLGVSVRAVVARYRARLKTLRRRFFKLLAIVRRARRISARNRKA